MAGTLSFKDRLMVTFLPPLAAVLIRLIAALLRIEFIGREQARAFWDKQQCVIFAAWHDQLLMMVHGYEGPGAKILISPSKDGELIARTIRCFGLEAVRGSSSRGGREALRNMVSLGREEVDLGITPDGPKGPRHQLKAGVVQLARLTGRPVIPLAFVCSRGYRFNSWDRFLLPFPWGHAVYSFGEPVVYDEGETFEGFQQRLQDAMVINHKNAISRLEENGVSAV